MRAGSTLADTLPPWFPFPWLVLLTFQWLLVRKWNSFQRPAVNGPIFSAEKGNLVNLHSGKYSGLANNKIVDISANPEGAITVTKITANGGKVASARKSATLRRSTGPRRAAKIAAVETATKGFRADLRHVSIGFHSTQLL